MIYSCGPLYMDEQRYDDLLEPTYSSSVPIRGIALKTCWKQWMIGRVVREGYPCWLRNMMMMKNRYAPIFVLSCLLVRLCVCEYACMFICACVVMISCVCTYASLSMGESVCLCVCECMVFISVCETHTCVCVCVCVCVWRIDKFLQFIYLPVFWNN